ncbi:MAG: hypothetical protein HS126_04630 [Anaerolineales bacterium]|nr:hypothetical protein [Anaerolineales bacterium]
MKMTEQLWGAGLAGLLLALTACSSAAPTETPAVSPEPAVVAASPTAQPLPEPTPTATSEPPPTATPAPPPPSATPTETPAPVHTETPDRALAADLQATVEAGLPPSPTPDADGFGMGGFDGVSVLPLAGGGSGSPYWAAFTTGFRSFDPLENHFVAIYTQTGSGWQEVSRVELENPDYLDPASVSQVQIEPGHIWLEVQGGAGAHSGAYDLLSFDGQTLRHDVSHFTSSPGGSRIEDLNEDGLPDVLLDLTEYYVFCFACGVTHIQYQVLRWDGERLSEVVLTPLPGTAPAPLRDLTNRAVELAEAGLWRDAHETINQAVALDTQDPLVTWDAALIRLHAEERFGQARGPYPLLGNIFYGDYAAALDVMRPYSMEEIFGRPTPLITDTPAMGWEAELSQWIVDSATPALQAQPDLAAAYFLRGWARRLVNPNDPEVLADIEQAAKLDPEEPLFSQSLMYLKQ